jgi:hypothetical protein
MGNKGDAEFHSVTVFRPIRTFVAGVCRCLAGMLLVLVAVALWTDYFGLEDADWASLFGEVLALLVGIALLCDGVRVARMAFSRKIFILAGPDGLILQYPKFGWFGHYKQITSRLGWYEIVSMRRRTHYLFLVPFSTVLLIRTDFGEDFTIPCKYFKGKVERLIQSLQSLRSSTVA